MRNTKGKYGVWIFCRKKVWLFEISKGKKSIIATGSNDSKIFFWKDVTVEDEKSKKEKEHQNLI